MLTVVCLSNDEQFLEFLDPDLVRLNETQEVDAIKTLDVEVIYTDFTEAKKLFQPGHKLWVQGHDYLEDCLYVINTEVEQDVADDHTFSFEVEEVLVELNYAPLALQTELTSENKFTINNTNDAVEVTIDWNALHYWFGDYFNIGIIQKTVGSTNKISFSGSMTLMSLLRLIEESTGNKFITRYEKDVLDNVIHRYLDFLNPLNTNKNWEWNFEYDFQPENVTISVLDNKDQPTDDTYDDVEEDDDIVTFSDLTPVVNINPDDVEFRILDADSKDTLVSDDGNELVWTAEDVGFEYDSTEDDAVESVVFKLKYTSNVLSLSINEKSFIVDVSNELIGCKPQGYVDSWTVPADISDVILPNGSIFEIYDSNLDLSLFQHRLYAILGDVHEDVLDLAYNVENISLTVDESNTYSAVSPVFSLSNDNSSSNELSRTDMNKIIKAWVNLEVSKGDTIPMIVEKVNVSGTSLSNAKSTLGEKSLKKNYYSRPYKPNDNTDSSDSKTYEFWRATAYWTAPFTKLAGDFDICVDEKIDTNYDYIRGRPDTRDVREWSIAKPKMGTTETSEEDVYAIYNAVAMYLKAHTDPAVEVEVDVKNYKDGKFNDYQLYEQVYLKLPGTDHLIMAQVEKTTKNSNLLNENTVTLSNFNLKTSTPTKETWIDASNANFKYPYSKTLSAILVNNEHDATDQDSVQYPSGKLITFTLYSIGDNDERTFKKVYTKKTDKNGVATIQMKYKPGDYELDIRFAGDVEYTESSLTVEISVGGTIEKRVSTKKKTTSKTNATKTKTVTTFWSKCGKSPDKEKVIGIGHYSASRSDARKRGLNYRTIYKTIFKNKCPSCGKKGTLVFDGGKNSCVNTKWHRKGTKSDWKYEHGITCHNCDADFDCVTGLNTASSHPNRLTTLKKSTVSGTSEFNKLVTGKLKYGTKKVTTSSKNNTSTKTRNNVSTGIPSSVKKKALSIVGNSKGAAAAKKIAYWCWKTLKYVGYSNHLHSPAWVLKHLRGNCCDQTRLMLVMMDAAGVQEYFTLKYVHVSGNQGGHIFARLYNKNNGKKVYVDPTHGGWNNCLQSRKYGFLPGSEKAYSLNALAY